MNTLNKIKGPISIDSVDLLWIDDPTMDGSDRLGMYSDKPAPVYIDRRARPEFRPHEKPFWIPCTAESPEDVLQDYQRNEALCRGEWAYQGCLARATVSYDTGNGNRRIEVLSSSGLWGIESDSSDLYKLEVEIEQLKELQEHLQVFGVDWNGVAEAILASKQQMLTAAQEYVSHGTT